MARILQMLDPLTNTGRDTGKKDFHNPIVAPLGIIFDTVEQHSIKI